MRLRASKTLSAPTLPHNTMPKKFRNARKKCSAVRRAVTAVASSGYDRMAEVVVAPVVPATVQRATRSKLSLDMILVRGRRLKGKGAASEREGGSCPKLPAREEVTGGPFRGVGRLVGGGRRGQAKWCPPMLTRALCGIGYQATESKIRRSDDELHQKKTSFLFCVEKEVNNLSTKDLLRLYDQYCAQYRYELVACHPQFLPGYCCRIAAVVAGGRGAGGKETQQRNFRVLTCILCPAPIPLPLLSPFLYLRRTQNRVCVTTRTVTLPSTRCPFPPGHNAAAVDWAHISRQPGKQRRCSCFPF